jgi:hypothetical protein
MTRWSSPSTPTCRAALLKVLLDASEASDGLAAESGSPLDSHAYRRIALPWQSAAVSLAASQHSVNVRWSSAAALEGEHRPLPAGDEEGVEPAMSVCSPGSVEAISFMSGVVLLAARDHVFSLPLAGFSGPHIASAVHSPPSGPSTSAW